MDAGLDILGKRMMRIQSFQISCPLPAGWTLSRAQKDIRICPVYDSYTQKGLSHDEYYKFD